MDKAKTNYFQIYTKLTKGLSPKTKDIFDRRFGVKTGKIETLDSIGQRLGITRERVRQIEEAGFAFVRKNNKDLLENTYKELEEYFAKHGGFKKESTVLVDLGGKNHKSYVLFLLTMGNQFLRSCEKKDYYDFWSLSEGHDSKVKNNLNSLVDDIKNHKNLLTHQELTANFASKYSFDEHSLASYLEVSKKIQGNKDGKLGLIDWPEIKPRGVKDKAYLVLKNEKAPLHFRKITQLIDGLEYNLPNKKTHAQTVHNELIKDARFVLVGRGLYALGEWGYTPGTIKDVISKVLTGKKEGAMQEDVVKEVLNQRMVVKNTILINLNNKKHFYKNEEGKYFLRETQTN